ncbi:uncharacterized protein F5147DRAFT_657129 [Suillus discolor]|uniref:Uncharacterized protein n=1 Tax=Suillus discolor TaxID=1912936 RepID=A0A9P7JP51_9AGAM|nr:uncharacterized protein F5147DRAFT_657129 [Suillus discolor]KAG2094658.1 hypothetical protein F5147DRAFT_657129 [Suillus discolor]
MPMVTQSDPESKNFGIANAHTMLRQWYDPALQGTLQHRWMQRCIFDGCLYSGYSKNWMHTRTNSTTLLKENFSVLDFKINKVEHKALDHVCDIYINPSHVIFNLIPQPFGDCVQCCYNELGFPLVIRHTV